MDSTEVKEALEKIKQQVKESCHTPIAEFRAELSHFEKHMAPSPFGRGEGVWSSSDGLGSLVAKGMNIEALKNNSARNARVGVSSFFETRAMIVNPGVPLTADRDREAYGPLARPNSIRDLLPVRPISAGSIEYLRGTRTGAAGIQNVEGDVKAELALNWTLQTAQVRTIAVWIPASRQVLDDMVELRAYIEFELRDALQLTEDAQLLNGNGTGSNIQGLMTAATAYDRAVVGDSANDTIRRAITQVQLARGVASGIVVSPQGLERLELEKDAEGRYLMAFNVIDANGRTNTWRVPVVVTDAMVEDGFLVADFERAARLYDRQQAAVEIATQHADFFTRNLVAILAEERVALTVNRPDLLVTGDFA